MGKERPMGTTKSLTVPGDESVAAFVAAVREALPAAGFWSMPVLAAVSGGGDSVALLVALRRLVPADAVRRLVVVHAEHDLRADAGDDRAFVEGMAGRMGLPFVTRRLEVRAVGGEGIEAAARRLRYAFFAEAAAETGGRHVVVAHTADDQAETILHRVLRGTAVRGLGGMSRARELAPGVSLLRPLLEVRRRLARDFLAGVGEEWREDPSNADRRHARNLLRHEVIATCERTRYPSCTEAIVRLGRQAAAISGALRSAAERLLDEHARRQADGSVVVRTAGLAGLDPLLLAEVFVALWCREGWPRRDMTARHYETLVRLALAERMADETLALPGPVAVRFNAGHVVISRPWTAPPPLGDRQ
jgi:tRNA(Ile)-lysidine synthase